MEQREDKYWLLLTGYLAVCRRCVRLVVCVVCLLQLFFCFVRGFVVDFIEIRFG